MSESDKIFEEMIRAGAECVSNAPRALPPTPEMMAEGVLRVAGVPALLARAEKAEAECEQLKQRIAELEAALSNLRGTY